MAISIRNKRAEELARRVARATGVIMTDAIIQALEEKHQKLEPAPVENATFAPVMSISRRCANLPTIDNRPEEKIIGYSGKDY
jgi:hypothetical protein